jgi:hypothetical protein
MVFGNYKEMHIKNMFLPLFTYEIPLMFTKYYLWILKKYQHFQYLICFLIGYGFGL